MLHYPHILQQMFKHAATSGWKEAEWHVQHGWWEGLPQLDTKMVVHAVQLVGFHTIREEVADLYNQVYILQRLPGRPPCSVVTTRELIKEIHPSLQDCLWWAKGETTHTPEEISYLQGGQGDIETELAATHDAHWWALATTFTLEEKIEQLSCSMMREKRDSHGHSKSHERNQRRSRGRSRMWRKAPSETLQPTCWVTFKEPESSAGEEPPRASPPANVNLHSLPELDPHLTKFLGNPTNLEKSEDHSKPPIGPPATHTPAIDLLEKQADPNYQVVARTPWGPWHPWLPGFGQEGPGFLWSSPCPNRCPRWNKWLCCASVI